MCISLSNKDDSKGICNTASFHTEITYDLFSYRMDVNSSYNGHMVAALTCGSPAACWPAPASESTASPAPAACPAPDATESFL